MHSFHAGIVANETVPEDRSTILRENRADLGLHVAAAARSAFFSRPCAPMQQLTSDDHPLLWVASEPLPPEKAAVSNRKAAQSQRRGRIEAPLVPRDPLHDRAAFYAHGFTCPVAAYPVAEHDLDVWGALLFYEVLDKTPRPDDDLLLGFPDGDSPSVILTKRGADRVRRDAVVG